ncbi:MAG: sugar transferase [Rhodospirillales bacterium]
MAMNMRTLRSSRNTHNASAVKPGMTGWAQIHGLRGALHTEEQLRKRIEYDLYYIDHWSIWLDLRILARTPFVVLTAENAY